MKKRSKRPFGAHILRLAEVVSILYSSFLQTKAENKTEMAVSILNYSASFRR